MIVDVIIRKRFATFSCKLVLLCPQGPERGPEKTLELEKLGFLVNKALGNANDARRLILLHWRKGRGGELNN